MALQKARQLALVRAQFQSLMESGPTENGLGNLNRSYKASLLESPPIQPRAIDPRIVDRRSTLVHHRIADIRRRSTSSHPVCLKCGDGGHFARDCRNALICFLCNKTGHKSNSCHSTTSFPSQISSEQSAQVSYSEPMAPPGFRRGAS